MANVVDAGTITVIDLTTNAVVDTVAVGKNPIGITVSGDRLYVTLLNGGNGEVAVLKLPA